MDCMRDLGGKANAELCEFLAQRLSVGKTRVTLLHGHTSRIKVVRVEGVTADDVAAALAG